MKQREAKLQKKQEEKKQRRREKFINRDTVMQDSSDKPKPIIFKRNKAKRRKINEIRRLALKGDITRQQERELLAPLLA